MQIFVCTYSFLVLGRVSRRVIAGVWFPRKVTLTGQLLLEDCICLVEMLFTVLWSEALPTQSFLPCFPSGVLDLNYIQKALPAYSQLPSLQSSQVLLPVNLASLSLS